MCRKVLKRDKIGSLLPQWPLMLASGKNKQMFYAMMNRNCSGMIDSRRGFCMGSGYGDIYTGTFGDAWMNGAQLDAVAPAISNLTPEKATALAVALGGIVVLDEVGLPDRLNGRVSESPVYDVEQCGEVGGIFIPAVALFLLLGRGGKLKVLEDNRGGGTGEPTGTGMKIDLVDGTTVVYRWKTGTQGSSAVGINHSGGGRVSNHRVHFYEKSSRYRGLSTR